MSFTVSRRRFLQASAVAAGTGAVVGAIPGLLSPAFAAHQPEPADGVVDCVVVGGGLSGLAAAESLAASGRTVKVLEARDRPGGRVVNWSTPSGVTVDGGAEFIGATQDRIAALATKYGVSTEPTYNKGWSVYYNTPNKTWFPAAIGLSVDFSLPELAAVAIELESLCSDWPVGRPWDHPRAAEFDAITWEDWVNARTITDSGKLQLSLIATSTLSVRPDEVSALFMLNYIAAAGNETKHGTATRLIGVNEGAQERFCVGGSALIPQRMAAALGNRIMYSAPVSEIRQTGNVVEVVTSKGTVKGRTVIVAMSPAIVNKITFTPGLPEAKTKLNEGYSMGRIGKFFAVYDTPFWRDRWLSGQTIGDGTPVDVTFESYADGKHLLMGFVSGDAMSRLDGATDEQIARECTNSLVTYFGDDARDLMRENTFYGWDRQEYSWGGPTGVVKPGTLTAYGPALTQPVGAIHWAGTETSDYWTGYMDGAVRSGERAAAEVHTALRS